MAEGKSLGEIQNELQMRKPYYKEQKKQQEELEIANAKKEVAEFMKDPFKDPTQELIDEYANLADSRKSTNKTSNASTGGNKT